MDLSEIGSQTSDQLARGARTMALPGVGVAGQEKISAARIVVIGAGGLGSPVLQYLASAGVGVIGIVDFDTVDLSNLQRQVIHTSASVGSLKTASAAAAIAQLNPDVRVVQHPFRLDRDTALDLLRGYDIVVDASDNFATRYLVSDCAAILRLPYVWGSVFQFYGQVSVFREANPDGPSLDFRDLHPVPPDSRLVLSCAEAGVLGSLCGTIGSMMASEVVKIVTGVGEPLVGRVQNLDALSGRWSEFEVRRSPERVPVAGLIDYEEFCGVDAAEASVVEISVDELRMRLAAGARLVDVRETWEHELGNIDGDELIPLAELVAEPGRAVSGRAASGPVVVYCASGSRSARAVRALEAAGISAASLHGGFAAWRLAAAESA